MNVLILLMWLSFCIVTLAIIGYAWSIASRSHEESERLAILPLENEKESTT